jgi:hypothetical protein
MSSQALDKSAELWMKRARRYFTRIISLINGTAFIERQFPRLIILIFKIFEIEFGIE